MKWSRVKKYLRERPYLLDEDYKLSLSDAQKLIDRGEPMTFEEMIRKAMEKSALPPREWEKYVRALTGKEKKREVRRRLIIAAAAAAALAFFFGATPTGRAWAKSAIEWVVSVFDGKMIVENEKGADIAHDSVEYGVSPAKQPEHVQSNDCLKETFNTFDELYETTGINPVIVDHEDFAVRSITLLNYTEQNRKLVIVYYSDTYGEMITHEIWGDEHRRISLKEKYLQTQVFNETFTMYYTTHLEDNLFEGRILFDDSVFVIGFSNEIKENAILESMRLFK